MLRTYPGAMGRPLLLPLFCTLALGLAACGGNDDDDTAKTNSDPAGTTAAAPGKAFPKADGTKDEDTLLRSLDGQGQSYTFAPAFSQLAPRTDRVSGLLLDPGGDVIDGVEVAFYTARSNGTKVRGPFVARVEPFGIRPQFISAQTSQDPDTRKDYLAATLTDLPTSGKVKLLVVGRGKDGKLRPADASSVPVSPAKAPPEPGDQAISVATLTGEDVRGDYSKISTREPPAKDLQKESLDDVLGKKPVVVAFATPALCQSRVCGPSVDVLEQIRSDVPEDDVAMIHQEIYVDNDPNKGLRPQVTKYRLLSEPWTYVIDASGKVSSRFEGPVSVRELSEAVEKVRA